MRISARPIAAGLTSLTASAVVGCATAPLMITGTPNPGTSVRLWVKPTTPVRVLAASGDTQSVSGVRHLDGTVEQARGDTVTLRLSGVTMVRGEPFAAPRVIVVLGADTRVDNLHMPTKSTGARAGLAILALAGGLLLLILVALAADAARYGGGRNGPGAVPAVGAAGR